MIKFDYTIERRDPGNNEIRVFKPDNIPTELPNLVHIEDENSAGKSTLLHILALSMYGLENEKINPELRKKMDGLLNSKHQKLKFNVIISNENESLKIISTKNEIGDPEILVLESKNGDKERPLSPKSFRNKYNLIYDIPNNPTGRLKDLTEEIKDAQNLYGNKVADLGDYIRTIVSEISESRDPKRLEELKSIIKQLKNDKEGIVNTQTNSSEMLDTLEKYIACKYYVEYMDKAAVLDERIQGLEQKRGSRTQVKKTVTTKYTNLYNKINTSLDEIDNLFRNTTPLLNNLLPKKEQNHINIWNRINLHETIRDYEFSHNLKKETLHFISVMKDEEKFVEENTSLKEAQAISDLIDFLKGYEDSLDKLPGIEMSLKDFIKTLEQSNKINQELVVRSNNLDVCIAQLNELNDNIKSIETQFPKLKNLSEQEAKNSDTKTIIDDLDNDISNLKINLDELNAKIDHYTHLCFDKDIDVSSLEPDLLVLMVSKMEKNKDLSPYFKYNEKQLNEKIIQLHEDLKNRREEIDNKDYFIRDYNKEVNKLEEKEPHKYQEYSDYLDILLKKTTKLRQKLVKEYNEYISSLIMEKPMTGVECVKYYSEVSKYLAKRIGTFRHIDKDYNAIFVDLVSGTIMTETDTIKLNDMGTGQSQSAYLTGLLNAKDDTRKIIAFFDEVAMMDSSSLDKIYQKMKELYYSDRLLAGIVVQRANETKIMSLL